MPGGRTLVVSVVLLAPIETGLWCAACLLPSGVKVTFGMSTCRRILDVRTIAVCHDCGQRVAA